MTAPVPVPVPDVAALCDADRAKAAQVLGVDWDVVRRGTHIGFVFEQDRVDRVAAALAAERAAAAREAAAVKAAVQRVEGLADEATRRLDWHIMVFDRGEARYVPLAELRRALDGGQP